MNLIQGNYVNYSLGNPKFSCHFDAVHAERPRADVETGEMVFRLMEEIGVSGIISKISRTQMDLNRSPDGVNDSAIVEYRRAIRTILDSKGLLDVHEDDLRRKYLHVALHGMKDSRPTDFEIGSRHGESCDGAILDWFRVTLENSFPNSRIGVDSLFPGDTSKEYHRKGHPDSDYEGFGSNFNTIQLEVSREIRTKGQESLFNFLESVATGFDREFNHDHGNSSLDSTSH